MKYYTQLMTLVLFLAGIPHLLNAQDNPVALENRISIDVPDSVDVEPIPTNMLPVKKEIGYPQIARHEGIQGLVVVRVLVSPEGKVLDFETIKYPHEYLVKAVEEHIPKLTFTPAMLEGKPVAYWVNLPFNFKLLDRHEDKKSPIQFLKKKKKQ